MVRGPELKMQSPRSSSQRSLSRPKEAWTRPASRVHAGRARPNPPELLAPTWAGRLRQQHDAAFRRGKAEQKRHASWQLLNDAFDVVADDDARTVDEAGLTSLLGLLEIPMPPEQVPVAMRLMRADSKGRVNFDRFAEWFTRTEKQSRLEELERIREAFDIADRNDSGALDKGELAMLSKRLGTRLKTLYSSKGLNAAWSEMDPDGDGRVIFEEFRGWWMRRYDQQNVERTKALGAKIAQISTSTTRVVSNAKTENQRKRKACAGTQCKWAWAKCKQCSPLACAWGMFKKLVRCFILMRQMKRDKRGMSNAIGVLCARSKLQANQQAGNSESEDDAVIVEISSDSEEESEIDEAAQEAERRETLLEYAEYLGLNIYKHHSLLWIAIEALSCPVPDGWKEYLDGDGNVFFFKKDEEATEEEEELTGTSSYAHPAENIYRAQIDKCIKALEEYDLDELEYLREETLQVADALGDPAVEKEPTTRELFDEMDDDHSGYLNKVEVAKLCAKLGSKLPEKVLATAMADMDVDGDNEVTFEEFSLWWSEKTAQDRRQRQLRDAFDVVDERGTGSLPKMALQKVLRRVGEDLSTRELQNGFDAMLSLQKKLVRADVQTAFDMVDIGGTGTIPKNKMVAVATTLKATTIMIENATLMDSSSVDGVEQITFDEVAAWWEDQWDKERRRKQVQDAFARVDADGSGSLDKEEVKLFLTRLGNQVGRGGVDAAFANMLQVHKDMREKRAFDAFRLAASGNETLDRDQVDEAVASLLDCLRGTEFRNAFNQMEHNNAGRVTQSAFMEWYEKEDYGCWEDDSDLLEVFARVDVDGGGTIDKQELEEVFDDLGQSLTSIFGSSKLDAAFAAMSPNAEGEVSFENFKEWWLKSRKENEPPEINFAAFEIWYWGRVEAEQAQQEIRLVELFNKIDADGSGVLDKQEVAALAAELGAKLTGTFNKSSADLDEAFAEMDPDGDEEVTLQEFKAWWYQKNDPPVVEFKVFEEWYARRMHEKRQQDEVRVRQTFDRIDADGSGALDKQEVAKLSHELGEKLSTVYSKRKLDQAFAEMDPDGDGEVSFEEFRNWWFVKLDNQRKAMEEARDLQFKKDAFWARRGRGQQTIEEINVTYTEPPRIRRGDVRTKLLFRAVMEEDLTKIRSLVHAGVRWQSVQNKAGQTPQQVAAVAGKQEALALFNELSEAT